MSVPSAKAYITRMREDAPFRTIVNDTQDEAANWAFLRQSVYEFTLQEFREAQDEIYREYGITPM